MRFTDFHSWKKALKPLLYYYALLHCTSMCSTCSKQIFWTKWIKCAAICFTLLPCGKSISSPFPAQHFKVKQNVSSHLSNALGCTCKPSVVIILSKAEHSELAWGCSWNIHRRGKGKVLKRLPWQFGLMLWTGLWLPSAGHQVKQCILKCQFCYQPY